jgi:hypothetical protein
MRILMLAKIIAAFLEGAYKWKEVLEMWKVLIHW